MDSQSVMDGSAAQQETFPFREIQLHMSEVLGAGSYGKVCKATCDGLACAAKVIHSTLFDLKDPGSAVFMGKFDAECRLLSRVRHPNIVLYLATYSDPDTKLPVLLMELCDESLTKFLERAPNSLAFHTQVNIAHDVALALVYLHSNEVIHRDLTSNNVLLLAGTRSKVTDFGMSKLASVNPRMTPLTQCPGNMLYMSPEALNEVPSYTKKLDVFSLGVLVVQILTRLFPEPTARFKVVDVSHDTRFGSKTVNVPVAETERRSDHLGMISDGNPLKSLALSCLKDTDKSRPTAQELSETLRALKESRLYAESVELWKDGGSSGKDSHSHRARLNSLRLQVQDLKQKEMKQQLRLSEQQVEFDSAQQHTLQEMEEEVQRLQAVVKEKERELQEARSAQERERILRTVVEAKDRELKNIQQQIAQDQQTEKMLRALVDSRDRDLQNCRQSLRAKEREIGDLQQQISTLRLSSLSLQQPGHRASFPTAQPGPVPQPRPAPQDPNSPYITLSPERSVATPYSVRRGSSAVYQSTAFITPEGSNKVYQITRGVDRWNVLPNHPHFSFGLAIFDDGFVTTVGGWNGVTYSNRLLTLTHERRWVERYPAMPTARIEASVVNTQHVLVVAGGYNGGMLDVVEVLTLYSMQWGTASRLPHPFYMASAVVCGDRVYLAGGYVAPDVKSKSLLTCSIPDLLHSLPTSSLGAIGGQVWKEAQKLPYNKCTLVSQGGRLMAVGGKGDGGGVMTAILVYDLHSESWRRVSDLAIARHQCFSFSFPGDILYVVGGEPKNLSTEVMQVVLGHMKL